MATLPEKRVNFNPKLHISHTGSELSTDAGLVLVKELMAQLNFTTLAYQLVHFDDQRHYARYSNVSLLEQVVLQLIAGYPADLAATSLRDDPTFKLLLAQPQLASQPSLSRFWQRCDEQTITSLQTLNQALLDQAWTGAKQQQLILDIDSTHADTHGHQEKTAFNAHYGTTGYHPLVAFDVQTGHCLKAQLRPGNVYTSTDIAPFITPLLQHYHQVKPNADILVCGDSGFATPELYETCEANDTFYLIRLKANRRLNQLAERFVQISDEQNWTETEVHYYRASYQARSWPKPRQIYIKSTRPAGELLFQHEYLVSNLTSFVAEDAFHAYHQRGQMENYIKEAKAGFYLDKMTSLQFIPNYARMMLSVLAYNLVSLMRQLLPAQHQRLQVTTLRLWLFKVAGKLVTSGRQLYLKLSRHHVYQDLFYQLLARIQALQWG